MLVSHLFKLLTCCFKKLYCNSPKNGSNEMESQSLLAPDDSNCTGIHIEDLIMEIITSDICGYTVKKKSHIIISEWLLDELQTLMLS